MYSETKIGFPSVLIKNELPCLENILATTVLEQLGRRLKWSITKLPQVFSKEIHKQVASINIEQLIIIKVLRPINLKKGISSSHWINLTINYVTAIDWQEIGPATKLQSGRK